MQLENVTKRSYGDACGLAHALDLIGERWALLVLRELMLGPRRFSQLRADLPGISANTLTQRLTELERRGLVARKRLPPPANVQVYEATDWGLEAAPIVCQLSRWAYRSPVHDSSQPVSAAAIMLSMQANFLPERAGAARATLVFRFGEADYFATVGDGAIAVGAGRPETAVAVIRCRPDDLKPLLYGAGDMSALDIEGDRAAVRRFAGWFALPAKVQAQPPARSG